MSPHTAEITTAQVAELTSATYHLLIHSRGQTLYHGRFDSAQLRLTTCLGLLEASDIVPAALQSLVGVKADAIRRRYSVDLSGNPDAVMNVIIENFAPFNFHIVTSETSEEPALPPQLFSVITHYSEDYTQTIAEHFTSQEARRLSLARRAGTLAKSPQSITEDFLSDEPALASLLLADTLTGLLKPGVVRLANATLCPDTGTYIPADRSLTVT